MRRTHRSDFGALILGGLLVFVGAFYVLRNTFGFDVGELNGDAIWPILVVALGVGLLYGVYDQSHREGPTH